MTCSVSRLSFGAAPVSIEMATSPSSVAPALFSSWEAWRRGDTLAVLDSDSREPCDCSSASLSTSASRFTLEGMRMEEDRALLLLLLLLVWLVPREDEDEEVIEALHMGQFCFIFSQGSTHFLWNSWLNEGNKNENKHQRRDSVNNCIKPFKWRQNV